MRIDKDDPRLTAYVLGELDDEQRAAFEAEIAGDDAVTAEIEALRALATSMEKELTVEGTPALKAEQRAAILDASDASVSTASSGGGYGRLAVAAAVLVAVPVLVLASQTRGSENGFRSPPEEGHMLFAGDGDNAESVGDPQTTVDETLMEVTEEAAARRALLEGATAARTYETRGQGPVAESGGPSTVTMEPGGLIPPGPPPPTPTTPSIGLVMGGTGVAGGGNGGADSKPVDGVSWNLHYGSAGSAPHGRFFGREGHGGFGSEGFNPRVTIPGTEAYDSVRENPFTRTIDVHTSTFSIDVDTASYANVRRFLVQNNRLPPPQAVRVEELINYFPYAYEAPADDATHPFAAHVQIAACPWNPQHRLARVALKGKTMETHERPSANLVFLVDVSGSMRDANKLPLAVKGLKMMLESLDGDDRVGIVTYAGQAQVALASTSAGEFDNVAKVIDGLRAGGSTNGGSGIQMAYDEAQKHFIEGGVNRVVLLTDGDFNVGISDRAGLVALIQEKAKSNVFLSVVGFGQGNLKDAQMEELSNKGNGNYAYVDGEKEARKIFVEELTGALVTIAKDVKIQVQFNPKRVAGYRLIGYENRRLAARDFNDDAKDAGEIGAGHTVTALYELVPAGIHLPGPRVDPNPFVDPADAEPEKEKAQPPMADSKALFKLRLRYKQPESLRSVLMEQFAMDEGLSFEKADDDFQWAAAVAGFGMLLRGSAHLGQTNYDAVLEIAKPLVGEDEGSLRREFLNVVTKAKSLAK